MLLSIGSWQLDGMADQQLSLIHISMKENKFRGKGVILEIKVTKDIRQMEEKCREALEQIEENHYEDGLVSDGYDPILKYGICFFKKGCMGIHLQKRKCFNTGN